MESSPNAWLRTQDLDLCWRPREPATSEQTLRVKLPEATALTGDDRGFLAELLTQIGRAEAAQGKLTEARFTLDAAEKLLAELSPESSARARIRLLLEEGRIQILLHTPSQARTRFSQAWALAVGGDEDFFLVDIARMMAKIEPMKQQEEWISRAIGLAEQSPHEKTRRWLGELYADLGWRQYDLRQYETALATHRRSMEAFQRDGNADDVFYAAWAVGRVLRQLGRASEALAWNEDLLRDRQKANAPDGRLYEELGECLLALKKPEAAQPHFARAHQELSREGWLPDRHPLRLKRLKDLGKVD